MNISTKYNNFPDIIIDNNTIIPKESRTCLGIMADRNLKLNYNIKRLFRLGNYNFVNIARVRKCLVTSSILLLIALVLFKFGYCSIIFMVYQSIILEIFIKKLRYVLEFYINKEKLTNYAIEV